MVQDVKSLDRNAFRGASGQSFRAGGSEYVLSGRIGDGAAGLVRKAENANTKELVAVKFLAPDWNYLQPQALTDISTRFKREGTRGKQLSHPNLVRILAYEENDGGSAFDGEGPVNPFIVMEYVRGKTLESLIRRLADFPYFVVEQSARIARAVCEALVYLHRRALIHRDVKPANIFISDARPGVLPTTVKLGDFGVLKWGDYSAHVATGTLTLTDQSGLGTTKYMAPEQAMSPKEVSVRADMWSFGITLFELFTGSIFGSPQQVFGVSLIRQQSHVGLSRKLMELGLTVPADHDVLWQAILNMFSFAASGRPSSKQMLGKLNYIVESLRSE